MNNSNNAIFPNFSIDEINNQNPYPNNQNGQKFNDNNQKNNQNSLIYSLLPQILAGKGINEVLPSLFGNNPLLASIMSNIPKAKKNKITNEEIKSDKIDLSNYKKID